MACLNPIHDNIGSYIATEFDAKQECQRLGSTCGGFIYSEGCVNGHSEGYAICGTPIVTIKPAECVVLHRVKGKMDHLFEPHDSSIINIQKYMIVYQYIDFGFLGSRYFQTYCHGLCSDNGNDVVDDIETCKEAAEELNLNFVRSKNDNNWPGGCTVEGRDVYFNEHSTGNLKTNVNQICKPKGKY